MENTLKGLYLPLTGQVPNDFLLPPPPLFSFDRNYCPLNFAYPRDDLDKSSGKDSRYTIYISKVPMGVGGKSKLLLGLLFT